MYKVDPGEKKELAISACLDQFCQKGLYETTSRDLSRALKLQSGGMYSYFSTKDEAVLVCAEEAAFLLEKYLIELAINNINDVDVMFEELLNRADRLSHMMKFFAQVCSTPKYRVGVQPILNRLALRYKDFVRQLAQHLNCPSEQVQPFFYTCVSAISNYMIFGEKDNVLPQIEFMKRAIIDLCDGK